MRAKIEQYLQQRWYGARTPGIGLRLLEAIYKLVRPRRLPVRGLCAGLPVIVVGNISVGGTGKTPLVIWLWQYLTAQGLKVGVVSRGYGASPQPRLHVAQDGDDWQLLGDEPALMFANGVSPICVCRDRASGVAHLSQKFELDLVLADDGLQNQALPRCMEVAVVDGLREFGNARLLPAGPLREPIERLDHVDFVVQNGGQRSLAGRVEMRLQPADLRLVKDGSRSSLAAASSVTAVAGIGNPVRFFETLRGLGYRVNPLVFADHHPFKQLDFAALSSEDVIMTEKDAIKCGGFATERMFYLPVAAVLGDGFGKKVLANIESWKRG